MPKYRISGPYWDGEKMHAAGSVVEFDEGKAPDRSKLVEEPAEKPAKAKAAE